MCTKCGASDALQKYYKMEFEIPLTEQSKIGEKEVWVQRPFYPQERPSGRNPRRKLADGAFRGDAWTQEEFHIYGWENGCKVNRIDRDKLSVRLMNVSIEHLAKAKEHMIVKLPFKGGTIYQKITVNPGSLLESKVTSENWKACVGLEGYEGYEEYEEYEGYEDSEIEYESEYYD